MWAEGYESIILANFTSCGSLAFQKCSKSMKCSNSVLSLTLFHLVMWIVLTGENKIELKALIRTVADVSEL